MRDTKWKKKSNFSFHSKRKKNNNFFSYKTSPTSHHKGRKTWKTDRWKKKNRKISRKKKNNFLFALKNYVQENLDVPNVKKRKRDFSSSFFFSFSFNVGGRIRNTRINKKKDVLNKMRKYKVEKKNSKGCWFYICVWCVYTVYEHWTCIYLCIVHEV